MNFNAMFAFLQRLLLVNALIFLGLTHLSGVASAQATDLKNSAVVTSNDQKIIELEARMRDEIDAALGIWLGVNANLLAVFVGVLAVLGTAIVLISWYLKNVAANAAVASAEERVAQIVDDTSKGLFLFTQLKIYGKLSYTFWGFFTDDFRQIASDPKALDVSQLEIAMRYAGLSAKIADDAIEVLNDLMLEDYFDVRRRYNIDVKQENISIRNNALYLQLIKRICEDEINGRVADSVKFKMIHEAEILVRLVNERREKYWFESYDTAARVFIRFGDQSVAERGRELVSSVVSGKKPSRHHVDVDQERKDKFVVDFNLPEVSS